MNEIKNTRKTTQTSTYNPDVHPLAMLDGMETPVHVMWKLAHEPLRNFWTDSYYCEVDQHGRLRPKAGSHDKNRLRTKCGFFEETRQWYDLIQRELGPLVEPYFIYRNTAFIERYHEEDPDLKREFSRRLCELDRIIHDLELKGPRLLKYMAVMSLHQNTPTMNRRLWRLMCVRLECFVSLIVRNAEGDLLAYSELCDMLQVMEAATQAALRGYVSGGWRRDGDNVVALWPEVAAAPSVLTVGTGF